MPVLSTLAAVALLSSPAPQSCVCHADGFYDRDPQLNAIVARAWREWEEAHQDEDPKVAQQRERQAKQHQEDIARDSELGKKYSEEVAKTEKFSENAEYIKKVETMGATLAEIARTNQVEVTWGDKRLNPFNYTFKVIKGKDVNAFSLPGGFIFIYEGLIEYAESDHELAGVLAHEIAHAAFRHVATLQREQSRLSTVTLPLILLGLFSGGSDAGLGALQLGNLIGQAKGSGWSLQAEDSADSGGFQYMLKSPYNPVGMLTFMERLARDERGRPNVDWGIYQTHPLSKERATNIYRYLAEAGIPARRSAVTKTFKTEVKPGESGSTELWFGGKKIVALSGSDSLQRADAAAKTLDAMFDETPELFQIQIEDGDLVYKRRKILDLNRDDAVGAGATQEAFADQSLRNVRAALFSLGFRVWDLRG